MSLKRVFGVFGRITNFRKYLRLTVDRANVLFYACFLLIMCLVVTIRILPSEWGFNLSEFDPYYQYDVTRHLAENGLFSWQDLHLDDIWFPQGRDVALASFPAFPMTGAVFYFVISSLGFYVSVLDVCIIFPIIMAVFTCIALYYLGKELGGRGVGLLSGFFLAISPAYIGRTSLGFYDDETVGIFGVVLTSLFFIRSLKSEGNWRATLGYALAAGLGFGYVSASWGASRYLISLVALFSFLLLVLKRYRRQLLVSYGSFLAVGLSIAVLVPKLGLRYIQEFEILVAIGVFVLLLIQEFSQQLVQKKGFIALTLAGITLVTIVLWYFGLVTLPSQKFISVLNPFERFNIPLIQSVQEHRPATWASFYYQFGMLVFLAPLGIIFAVQQINAARIYMITYAVTALYFSASLIRLTILAAPAFCILGALALVEILQPFISAMLSRVSRRRYRFIPRIGRSFSVLLIIVSFALVFLPLLRGIDSGYAPTTIAASSLPVRAKVTDWSEALTWMKENLHQNTVVVSWWDYGYWITVMGEQITLTDNGTTNTTQISWVGRLFMSTEEDALTMLHEFNEYTRSYDAKRAFPVSYVVVFTTIGQAQQGQLLYGDEVKWRWMAQIAGLDDVALEDTSVTSQIAEWWSQQTQDPGLLEWYQRFAQIPIPKSDRVLTKLMIYGTFPWLLEPEHFQLSFASSNRMVFVYKIRYS